MKKRTASIHHAMRMAVCVAFLLCALVGVVLNRFLVRTYNQELAERHRSIGESYYLLLSGYLSSAADISLQVISNAQIQSSLRTINGPASLQEKAHARSLIQSSIGSISIDIPPYIDAIAVIDNEQHILSFGALGMQEENRASMLAMVARTPDDAKIRWETASMGSTRRDLVLVRAIRESRNVSLQLLGYETIYVNVNSLMQKVAQLDPEQSANTVIILGDERVYIGDNVVRNGLSDMHIPQEGWQIIRMGREDYFAHVASFMNGQIRLVTFASYSSVTKVQQITITSLLLLLVPLLLIMLTALRMTNSIFKRLNLLTKTVRLARHQDMLEIPFEGLRNGSDDEVDALVKHIQKLMNHISHLASREVKEKLFATQAQFRMLQAQINPHFLHNTLDTIFVLAKRTNDSQLIRMTLSLTKLVRASYMEGTYVRVENELDFVMEYLSIYQIRYPERMRVSVTCGADIEDVRLPKMTIQPLIENAIRYGLMQKIGVGHIRLSIRRKAGRLIISVVDNGKGVAQSIIDKYTDEAFDNELEMHGLANVICRLRHAYQRDAIVSIRSKPDCWTNIAISIPDRLPKEE